MNYPSLLPPGSKVFYRLSSRTNPHPGSIDQLTRIQLEDQLAEIYEQQERVLAGTDPGDSEVLPASGAFAVMGYDAEWVECPGDPLHPLKVLSYQFHLIGIGGEMSACYMPPSSDFSDRLSLHAMLGEFIRHALRCGVLLEPPAHVMFVGFFLRVDLALLSDLIEFKQQLSNVGGKIATTRRPVEMSLGCVRKEYERLESDQSVFVRNGRLAARVNVSFYDISRHAAEKTKLETLGESLRLPKRKIKAPFSISRMDEYRRVKQKCFVLYGMRDAEIPARYYVQLLKFAAEHVGGPPIKQGFLPPSAGALAVQMFKITLKQAGMDFDQVFGVSQKVIKPWDDRQRRYRPKLRQVKDEYRDHREGFAIKCYHGGRNEAYYFGLGHDAVWNDFDLIGAYTMGMLIIRQIDYKASFETKDIEAFTADVMGFAWVRFAFPKNTRFPCLPVRSDQGSLVFPRTGESFCTEPPRILRRLQPLRRWSHEEVKQVLT